MSTLVLWEVSQKQKYIFTSNRLKEIKGASIVIDYITTKLPTIINEEYKEKVVFDGGGSSLYRFESEESAKEFIKLISECVLKEFPGIELFMVLEKYDENEDKIIDVLDRAYKNIGRKKDERKYSGSQIDFGIERRCYATNLPAVDYDKYDKNVYISKEIRTKLEMSNNRDYSYNDLIPEKWKDTVDSSDKSIEFQDLLDQEKDKNYIGIIHIDGNRMGEQFANLKKDFKERYNKQDIKKVNDDYLRNLKSYSNSIDDLFKNAFKHLCKVLSKAPKIDENRISIIPIILSGDDVTYVINGSLAIESARVFIDYINRNPLERNNKKININACGGVAIVKSSYPFNIACDLAENLCENAKMTLQSNEDGKDYSLIDWHIDQGDISGSIKHIRENYYRTKNDNKSLSMKPLYLNNNNMVNSYEVFTQALENIKLKNEEKILARSKIKKLKEVLTYGQVETEQYLKINNLEDCFVNPSNRIENGYQHCFLGDVCVYFDAIEAIDFFINLE